MGDGDYTERGLNQIQNILNNERFQDVKQTLFGEALLDQLVDEYEEIGIENLEELISIAFRIEQIAIRLWSSDDSSRASQESKDCFETAAKLFEQLADVQSIPSRWVRLELYLHSAIDYSLGEFQANSTVMARKVLDQFEFDNDTYSIVLQTTFLLLRRDIRGIENTISQMLSAKTAFEQDRQGLLLSYETRGTALEEIAHFITLEGILNFAQYLMVGRDDLFEIARTKIISGLELFTELRDADNFVLTQLIFLLIRQMHFASLWYQLGDLHGFRSNQYLNRYLHVLTNDKDQPIYELWQSQIDALDKVLSDSSAVVLQMPTSAGKTRIAEIDIVNKLANSDQVARCIYVAPYKSLAAQIERSLDKYLSKVGYRVTTIFGSFESVEFEDTLIDQNDILVITPEKLDYLLRQSEELFQTVKLIVIDEGHLLDDDVRGIRLEFLLERIRRRFTANGLKILFISAVIPNSEEISSWLIQGEPVVADSKWKPTKLSTALR